MANLQISVPITVAAALFIITVLWGIISKLCSVLVSKTAVDRVSPIQAVVAAIVSQS